MTNIKEKLKKLADPVAAKKLGSFFKTGKGEYGEGDKFLGIKVTSLRKVAREYKDLSLDEVKELLQSPYHEHRMVALLILIYQYDGGDEHEGIVRFYLDNLDYVNNWDLVDLSAPKILGEYLIDNDRKLLYDLAGSDGLWKRRVAIISTLAFIRNHDFEDALKISEMLLSDKHDLIHKAVGWMLREIGNRDMETEEIFLDKHVKSMPRTMLRYAIEKFEPVRREHYMKK